MSEDVSQQIHEDLSDCECFLLQFDESVDMTDMAQLIVLVHMAFKGSSTKKDFLTLLPLREDKKKVCLQQIQKVWD